MQILENVTSLFCGRMKILAQNPGQELTRRHGINRWAIYKQLCLAKSAFNLNDRCLAVLSSLLSFLPDDVMAENKGLVVFPSNRQLSLRAHGMPESTLRRHLSSLIQAGIIARKDSPTRKRYAHKNREGQVELAFGFSFAPLVDRAEEITTIAEKILADQKLMKRLRDEVSVLRRDIASSFAETAEEAGKHRVDMEGVFVRFREVVDAIPRRPSPAELSAIKAQLEDIRDELTIALKTNQNVPESSGSDAQSGRHHYESQTESLFESQNGKKIDLIATSSEATVLASLNRENCIMDLPPISLDQVLRACPDIREYGPNGVSTWRELHDASQVVSGFLGISPSAYREALSLMGANVASTVIAWILQKLATISSPGGYLRALTQKAKAGGFSINQLLFSGMKANRSLAMADLR